MSDHIIGMHSMLLIELSFFRNDIISFRPNFKKEFKVLGQWCSRQRFLHKKGKLSPERFDLLDSIGFKWKN